MTKIFFSPCLKDSKLSIRSSWSIWPYKTQQENPFLNNCFHNSTASFCSSTNIMVQTLIYFSNISNSLKKLFSFFIISTCCSIFFAPWPFSPTKISTGRFNIFFAINWICLGNVALNITICLWGLMFLIIFDICGSKPKSNIRSASSKTTKVVLNKFVIFPLDKHNNSINLAGVATAISTPRLSSFIWLPKFDPPKRHVVSSDK